MLILEPKYGSDVANLETEAKKTPDGKFYIVNGQKKWITNGIWADYFTVAVRTGGEGARGEEKKRVFFHCINHFFFVVAGVSLLLIEREMEGVSTRAIPCTGGT
jgi:alkylation response protein AidB-like acyl-CoA dehydrogenase